MWYDDNLPGLSSIKCTSKGSICIGFWDKVRWKIMQNAKYAELNQAHRW